MARLSSPLAPLRLALFAGVILLLSGGCRRPQARLYRGEGLHASARPLVMVDLDDTAVSGSGWTRSVLVPFSPPEGAFPGAADTLTRLRETHEIVFLTARSALFARTTLGWLDASGFPRAPVIFSSPCALGRTAQTHYKTCALRWLRAQGKEIACGIGDKQSDLDAYAAVGASSFLVLETRDDPDGGSHENSNSVVGHATAWRQIEAHLESARSTTQAASRGSGGEP